MMIHNAIVIPDPTLEAKILINLITYYTISKQAVDLAKECETDFCLNNCLY